MRKAGIIYILCFLTCTMCKGQNMVPNPGFELYNNCPQARSGIVFSGTYTDFPTALWWVSALWNTTPDYYNTCATNPLVTLPYNTYNDYQQPHGGDACAGISMFSGYPVTLTSDYREYLETRLSQPLVAGKKYYLSFFVNMAFHLPETANQIVIDMVGARFTDTQIKVAYPFGQPLLFLNGYPDIVNERQTYISDTAKWHNINGLYTAHGGEQWLTIGYFKDSLPISFTTLYLVEPNPDSIHSTCYMYVDDVCVTEVAEPTHDTIYTSSFPYVISSVQSGHYEWSTNDTTIGISVTGPGKYWVQTTDDCLYRLDTITVLCIVDSTASDTSLVFSSFPAVISGSVTNGSFTWNTGDTTASISIYSPGIYWVSSFSGCRYRVDTVRVACDADVITDTTIYASSFPFQLGSEPGVDSVLWNNTDKWPSINVYEPGVYSVTVWRGCRKYIHTVTVLHRDVPDCIWMPSAFTPNGDGRNDEFGPMYSCFIALPYYRFSIYNRYGEQVFETYDIAEKWDGYYQGNQQDMGTYFYIVRYSAKDQDRITMGYNVDIVTLKGDLTLIR